jgi:hypothetical protein
MVHLNFDGNNLDYTQIIDDYKEIYNLLKNKRVCLVGPASSLHNKKLGKIIESYDLVVALNYMPLLDLNPEDYGNRIDIWITKNHFVNINITDNNEYDNFTCNITSLKKQSELIKKWKVKYIIDISESYYQNQLKTQFNLKNISNCKSWWKQLWDQFYNLDKDLRFYRLEFLSEINKLANIHIKNNNFFTGQTGISAMLLLSLFNLEELFICGFTFSNDYNRIYLDEVVNNNIINDNIINYENTQNINKYDVSINDIIGNTEKYNNNILYHKKGIHKISFENEKVLIKYLFKDSCITNIILNNDVAYTLFLENKKIYLKFSNITIYENNKVNLICNKNINKQAFNLSITYNKYMNNNYDNSIAIFNNSIFYYIYKNIYYDEKKENIIYFFLNKNNYTYYQITNFVNKLITNYQLPTLDEAYNFLKTHKYTDSDQWIPLKNNDWMQISESNENFGNSYYKLYNYLPKWHYISIKCNFKGTVILLKTK